MRTATDGLSALYILEKWIPDVMFIDLIMPDIGGDKLCKIIRSRPRLKDIYLFKKSEQVVFSKLDPIYQLELEKSEGRAFIWRIKLVKPAVFEPNTMTTRGHSLVEYGDGMQTGVPAGKDICDLSLNRSGWR